MDISLIYDNVRFEEKSILKAAQDRNVNLNMVHVKSLDMDLDAPLPDSYGAITLQRCTSYYRGLHSTAYLEFKGQKVVNDLQIQQIAGNKMFTSLALIKNGVPTPKTSVSVNRDVAMEQFTSKFEESAVLKPVTGSWGRMLALMNDRAAAMSVLEDREYMYPLYSIFYMQEFVKRPPRDIRVFVVGDRVIGGIYRYQPEGDWRSNTAIGSKAERCGISGELEDLVLKAVNSIGHGIFGVDVMEGENGYTVHEVNSTTEFKNTVKIANVDVPGEIVDFLIEEAR